MYKSITCLAALCTLVLAQKSIQLNQVGYYPDANKVAVVLDTSASFFRILESSGEVAFSGELSEVFAYTPSEEKTRLADFSELKKTGSYRLVAGHDTSYLFPIQSRCFNQVLKASIRSYFYQRCSYLLQSEFAGQWYRLAGHPDSFLSVLDSPSEKTYDVSGGWYDAGDYAKYVVNAGITCATLMSLYELCPDVIGDDHCIPESGNHKSDLLDEVKYELDWLLRMQDNDGGVFFKVGPVEWSWDVMPDEDDKVRYIIGKSTTSTLCFTSVMAMASRIYKSYDQVFAARCGDAAEKSWGWACANPSVVHPENVEGTGPYEDGKDLKYKDEFFWAATELYLATNKQQYKDSVCTMLSTRKISASAWWQDVNNLGFFSLATNPNTLGDSINSIVKKEIVTYADTLVNRINSNGYRVSMVTRDYTWGSTGNAGNQGVVLVYAHKLTGIRRYLDALVMTNDYLLGKNPVGYSYITGFGSHSPLQPHSRPMRADFIDEPIPGFVVGGANAGDNGGDEYLNEVVESGAPPAKCYVDIVHSWGSNENAINQNAPWVLILGYLESQYSGVVHTKYHNQQKEKRACALFDAIRKGTSVHVTWQIPERFNSARISIHDLAGREIQSCSIKPSSPAGQSSVDLKNRSGMFVVRMTIDDNVIARMVAGIKK